MECRMVMCMSASGLVDCVSMGICAFVPADIDAFMSADIDMFMSPDMDMSSAWPDCGDPWVWQPGYRDPNQQERSQTEAESGAVNTRKTRKAASELAIRRMCEIVGGRIGRARILMVIQRTVETDLLLVYGR
jgi:hypothetical protein